MQRIEKMKQLKEKGLSYQTIGNLFNISRQRIHQIIKYPHSNSSYGYEYEKMRQKAFKRDNYKCVLCNSKKIVIHHLDGNGASKNGKLLKTKEQDNNLNNLITLCQSCHTRIHKRKRGYSKKTNTWSRKYDKCIKCGTTDKKHYGKGLCTNCYMNNRYKNRRG